MAIHEVRQYQVKPGKMSDWLALMEGEIIPFVISKGMVMTASFRGEVDDTLYIWIRRFDDEAHLTALYEAVYESDHWKNVLSPKIGALLNRDASRILRVTPTALSPMQ
ncbi:NIPSNAP family protein [uncultured Roseovarius sp.]|uniref:NIPSNAP family protein n=1 Tax=uncultured Roseovarius sp. TaxID=293344 RepID=UPI002605AB09|nr:NIPSNAP family protein [uncultured Roseovarius sp.]